MTEDSRKRRLHSIRESDQVDCPAKQRKVDIGLVNGYEGRVQRVTRQLKDFFFWLADLPSKNYFIESTMSAMHLRSSNSTKNKSNTDTRAPSEERPEESSISPLKKIRYRNLKRQPVRECFNERENFMSARPLPSYMDGEILSNNAKRNVQVVRHPFKGSKSFQRISCYESSKHSAKKREDLKNGNGHCRFSPSHSTGAYSAKKDSDIRPRTRSGKRHLVGLTFQTRTPAADVQVHKESTCKKSVSTPQKVLELQERDQYKVLLEHFTRVPDHGIFPAIKPPSAKLDATHANTHPAFTKKKVDKNDLSDFLAKYVKINPKDSTSSNNNLPAVESSPMQNAVTEDDVIITDVKMLPPRPVPSNMMTSRFFDTEWIDELRKSFDNETSIREKMVENQVKKIQEYKRKRAAKIAEDEARNRNQYRLSGTILPEAVETDIDASFGFPELTQEIEDKIDEALKPDPPEEVLSEGFNIQVTRKDIETLSRLNWLNDEIIYFYISLLMERSKEENYPSVYAFNTFFYPKLLNGGHGALKRWTRKIDIFSYDLILVPVHMGMHWCLAVIDFRCKKIQYYDSMGGQNVECLHTLRDYLKDEHLDKKKGEFDMSFWIFENVKNIPHQMNGSDCGMFALKYAEYITRDAKINFTQEHMRYFRRRMVYEILMKKLM